MPPPLVAVCGPSVARLALALVPVALALVALVALALVALAAKLVAVWAGCRLRLGGGGPGGTVPPGVSRRPECQMPNALEIGITKYVTDCDSRS
jgi:hypothetical protein